jgi:hypothetical protein
MPWKFKEPKTSLNNFLKRRTVLLQSYNDQREKYRHTNQYSGTKSKEIDPHIYSQFIFGKDVKTIQCMKA